MSGLIKTEAKEKLQGLWGTAIVICLLMSAVSTLGNMAVDWIQTAAVLPPGGDLAGIILDFILGNSLFTFLQINSFFWLSIATETIGWAFQLAAMAFALSYAGFFLKLIEGKKPGADDFFHEKRYGESLITSLLIAVKIFLWSLLFIIPGIIKTFAYAMTPYLKYKNKNQSAGDCIKESCRLMDGYKASLFALYLSFIGWALLLGLIGGLLSNIPFLGTTLFYAVDFLGGAILTAYIKASEAVFYKELTYPYLSEKYGRGGYRASRQRIEERQSGSYRNAEKDNSVFEDYEKRRSAADVFGEKSGEDKREENNGGEGLPKDAAPASEDGEVNSISGGRQKSGYRDEYGENDR